MNKVDEYRAILRQRDDWEEYLLRESRLPGRRANIELAQAVAEEGDAEWFDHLLSFDATLAPVNTPSEFLAFCGALGQGKLLEEGDLDALRTLRVCAADPRWRMREAVAMALSRYGRADMEALLVEMADWAVGNLLERRAAAAGPCHPELLVEADKAERVIELLDQITRSLLEEPDRRSDVYKTLCKALGYCWSVTVAAQPEIGKPFMEGWMSSEDRDVRRIMKQNLKKKRLNQADSNWTETWISFLG